MQAGQPAREEQEIRGDAVEGVGHEQREEQVCRRLAREVVEVAARDPAGDSHQRVDHFYLGEIKPLGDLAEGATRRVKSMTTWWPKGVSSLSE